jgi:hypothetical protein
MARVVLTGLLIAIATTKGVPHVEGVNRIAGDGGGTDHHVGMEDGSLIAWAAGEGLAAVDEGTGPLVAILPASIEAIICAVPWPCEEALAVAWCESRFDPRAVGAYGERGLFQVHPGFWGPVPTEPEGQVAQAYAIWREHGWEPWRCRPS